MPKKRTRKKPQNNSVKNIVIKTLIGSAVSLFVFLALSLVASLILLKNDADESVYKYVIFALSSVAGFLGGFVAVRPFRKNGLVMGAMSAVIPCVIIIVTAILLAKSGLSATGWIFLASYIIFSSLGGIVAANKRK